MKHLTCAFVATFVLAGGSLHAQINLANGEDATINNTVNGAAGVSAVTGAGNNQVTVTDTGVLNGVGANSSAILINGDGTVISSGTLTANTGGGNTGNGVRIFGNGTVNNSGTITTNTGNGSSAAGINVGLMGNVTNSGDITTNGGPNSNGINVNGLNAGGTSTVFNSGNITTTGNTGQFSRGIAINFGGGMVTNTGTITTNSSADGGRGEGIIIFGDNATAINSGTITINGGGNFFDDGISIVGNNNTNATGAVVQNSGNITVNANGGILAAGVYIQGSADGITNSGMIQVNGGGGTANQGVLINGGDLTNFNNSGSITADGQGGTDSQALFLTAGNLGTFNNSGTMTSVEDTAVEVGGDLGSAMNSGTITGDLNGLEIGGALTGTISNSGNITGTNQNGIQLGTGDAVINNTGTVSGGASGLARTNAGNVTITNNGGTFMGGTDAGVNLNGAAGDDTLTDFNGTFLTNAAGSGAIRMGGGADVVTLTGSTVSNGNGAGTALAMGGGADMLTVNGFAVVNATMHGNAGPDVLKLNLYGLTKADIQSVLAQVPTATLNPDGTVSLPETGVFTLPNGGLTYDWASFDENAVLCAFDLATGLGTPLSPNQRALAKSLNPAFQSLKTGPDMQQVLLQIVLATQDNPGSLPHILNSLSFQPFSEMARNVGIENGNFLYRQMDRHWDNVMADFDGDQMALHSGIRLDTTGFELLDPTTPDAIQRWDRRLASLGLTSGMASDVPGAAFGGLDLIDPKDMYDPKQMVLDDPRRFGLWLAGQGIIADVNQNDLDIDDVHYDTLSVMLGMDYHLTREVYVGALFNYSYTDAPLDGSGSRFEMDNYQGGAYAGYKSADDGWYAHGYAVGGYSDYDQMRHIAFGTVNRNAYSNPTGWNISAGAKGGYLFDLDRQGNWVAGPTAGLLYTHVDVDGYTETGANSLNLIVGQQQADSLRSALGGKIQGNWQVCSDLRIVPTVTLEWLHEFMDNRESINGAFSDPGPAPFILETRHQDKDYGLVGAGVDFHIGDQWSAFVSYDALFGQYYLGHGIGGGARFEF